MSRVSSIALGSLPPRLLRSTGYFACKIRYGTSTSTRGMGTLKETSIRLKSIQSISKITKSMKMIASTKVNKAQEIMNNARSYADVSASLITNAELKGTEGKKKLYIIISSDRGLCGSVHSGLTRRFKAGMSDNKDFNLAILGVKCRSQISRLAADKILVSFDQVSKNQPTWEEAAAIAAEILKFSENYDMISILYNRFKSVISFEVKEWEIPRLKENLFEYNKLNLYEYEKETLEDYKQFMFANVLYSTIAENYASEMSAKRTAMENATKNAGEMIDKLTLEYNRSRQASITNELIDIITGVSAM